MAGIRDLPRRLASTMIDEVDRLEGLPQAA
jgi:hypothetical protein